jgi:hypothetical protein
MEDRHIIEYFCTADDRSGEDKGVEARMEFSEKVKRPTLHRIILAGYYSVWLPL